MKKANKKTLKKANKKTLKIYGTSVKSSTGAKSKLQLITERAKELVKEKGMKYRDAQKQAAKELK